LSLSKSGMLKLTWGMAKLHSWNPVNSIAEWMANLPISTAAQ
jgi:hypothetical protein